MTTAGIVGGAAGVVETVFICKEESFHLHEGRKSGQANPEG